MGTKRRHGLLTNLDLGGMGAKDLP
jgi:hypothetical protein